MWKCEKLFKKHISSEHAFCSKRFASHKHEIVIFISCSMNLIVLFGILSSCCIRAGVSDYSAEELEGD